MRQYTLEGAGAAMVGAPQFLFRYFVFKICRFLSESRRLHTLEGAGAAMVGGAPLYFVILFLKFADSSQKAGGSTRWRGRARPWWVAPPFTYVVNLKLQILIRKQKAAHAGSGGRGHGERLPAF